MARTSIGNPNVQRIIAEAQEQLGKAGYDPKMIDKLLSTRSVEVNDKDIVIYLKNNYLAFSYLAGSDRNYSLKSDVLAPDQNLDTFADDWPTPVKFVNMLPRSAFANPKEFAVKELKLDPEKTRAFVQLMTPRSATSQEGEVEFASISQASTAYAVTSETEETPTVGYATNPTSKALGVNSSSSSSGGGRVSSSTGGSQSTPTLGGEDQSAEDLLNTLGDGDYDQRARDIVASGVEELERIRQTKRRLAEELSSAEGNPQEIMRINAEMGDLNQSASEIMTKISEVKRFQDIMFNLMKSLYDIRQRGFDNIVQNIGRIGG